MDDKNLEQFEEFEDFHLEDLAKQSQKKKKLKSKKKGNRAELELAKLLSEHFGRTFARSVGSGNRWSQTSHLPSHAKTTLLGDLCPPEGFLWVLESKNGYENDIDLNVVMNGTNRQLEKFIEQAMDEANRSDRKPIIMWKRARKPWLAFLRSEDLGEQERFETRLYYKNWICVLLTELLEKEDTKFWFEE